LLLTVREEIELSCEGWIDRQLLTGVGNNLIKNGFVALANSFPILHESGYCGH
jgi:hypothetical protein